MKHREKIEKDFCYAGGFWHTGGATETQYNTDNYRENKQNSVVYPKEKEVKKKEKSTEKRKK